MKILYRWCEADRDVCCFMIDGEYGKHIIEVSSLDVIRSRSSSAEEIAYAKYIEEARALHGGSSTQPAVFQESGSASVGGTRV